MDVPFEFNDECHKAFDTLKKALVLSFNHTTARLDAPI
jgi:hypothetical protein